MRGLNESFFRAVCLIASVLLVVLFLLTSIDVTAERDAQRRLLREIEALSDENELLRARAESQLSLTEIERRAREELGMQPLSPGQIEYLDVKD